MFKHAAYALAAAALLAGGLAMTHEAAAQAANQLSAAPPGAGNNNPGGPSRARNDGDGARGVVGADRNCFQFGNRLVCQDEPRRTWWREGDHRCCHRHVRKVRVRYHGKVMFKYVYGKPHCHSGKLFLKHCVMGRY